MTVEQKRALRKPHRGNHIALVVCLALYTMLIPITAQAETECAVGETEIHVVDGVIYIFVCLIVGIDPDGTIICEWRLDLEQGQSKNAQSISAALLYSSDPLNLNVAGTLNMISGSKDMAGGVTGSFFDNGGIKNQPAGELRVRVRTERWNGSTWVSCLDPGYRYNSSSSTNDVRHVANMGTAPDCGAGTYRGFSWHHVFEGGAWRGGTRTTAGLTL